MNIQEVKAFMTADGELHESKEHAEAHQAILDLRTVFNKDPIMDNWGSDVEFKPVLEFILNNADIIRRFL